MKRLGVGATEDVTFTQRTVEAFTHLDAVRFGNGRKVLLQELSQTAAPPPSAPTSVVAAANPSEAYSRRSNLARAVRATARARSTFTPCRLVLIGGLLAFSVIGAYILRN